MTDKLEAAQRRANRAKAIYEDEIFVEAFKGIEEEYKNAWIQSEAHESRKRENLYQALQILADVQNHLKQIMAGGRMAQEELRILELRQRPKVA